MTDYLLQDGIQHQLTILGEALNKLKHEAPAVAARIPDLPDAIGLRHHVVHGYDTIQLRMIWGNISLSHIRNDVYILFSFGDGA